MDQPRIGQLLSHIIPLSDQDVEEILHEQNACHRKFGDIALSLGLAKPEHIWRAWLRQLENGTQQVDLDQIGVDVQALAFVSADRAREMLALPLRCHDNDLLIALAHVPDLETIATLEKLTRKHVKIVLADETMLRCAIDRYYGGTKKIA